MIIKTEQSEIQDYLQDASNTKGFCDAVLFPESTTDLVNYLLEANNKKTKVTVCGNRTGLTGASVPMGGVVISTEKMNRVLEINKNEKYAVVEPAVLLSDFFRELNSKKLYYPPDPTELNCFIGGTVATNASGSKTFKYGPTRNFILGLEVVLPTGEIINLERGKVFAENYKLAFRTNSSNEYQLHLPVTKQLCTKNAAGYFCKVNMDAIDLFIGSEGTLGIFTKIKIRLLDLPDNILSAVIFFNSEDDGLDFIERAREISYLNRNNNTVDSIDALALEYFDKNALNFLRDEFPNIPQNSESAVWFEQEIKEELSEEVTNNWIALIEEQRGDLNHSWIALNDKDKLKFKDFRHRVSTKVNEFISSNNYRKLGTDFAVPDSELKKFYHQITSEVTSAGLDFVVYGHFGNSHIHLNMLPRNDKEFESTKILYSKMCSSAIKLNGTFSAEHGVGKNKTSYLKEMYGEAVVKEMYDIKKTLDPNLILGYGNIFEAVS